MNIWDEISLRTRKQHFCWSWGWIWNLKELRDYMDLVWLFIDFAVYSINVTFILSLHGQNFIYPGDSNFSFNLLGILSIYRFRASWIFIRFLKLTLHVILHVSLALLGWLLLSLLQIFHFPENFSKNIFSFACLFWIGKGSAM